MPIYRVFIGPHEAFVHVDDEEKFLDVLAQCSRVTSVDFCPLNYQGLTRDQVIDVIELYSLVD
jgi:hypothetical protein